MIPCCCPDASHPAEFWPQIQYNLPIATLRTTAGDIPQSCAHITLPIRCYIISRPGPIPRPYTPLRLPPISVPLSFHLSKTPENHKPKILTPTSLSTIARSQRLAVIGRKVPLRAAQFADPPAQIVS